jgi:hypothetical protein
MSSLTEVIPAVPASPLPLATVTSDATTTPISFAIITDTPTVVSLSLESMPPDSEDSLILAAPATAFPIPCPHYAYFDPITGVCILNNQDASTTQHHHALTTAQAIGVGIVIGAFIMAVIGMVLLLMRKRRAAKKNAVIVVTDGKKYSLDEPDKPAYQRQIESVEDPSGYYYN